MKRLISAFLAMMLLFGPALADQAQVKTPGGPLNMREEPSTKSRLVKQLKNGSLITLVEEDADGWTKVRSGEKEGYVMTQYLNMTVTAVGRAATVKPGLRWCTMAQCIGRWPAACPSAAKPKPCTTRKPSSASPRVWFTPRKAARPSRRRQQVFKKAGRRFRWNGAGCGLP